MRKFIKYILLLYGGRTESNITSCLYTHMHEKITAVDTYP